MHFAMRLYSLPIAEDIGTCRTTPIVQPYAMLDAESRRWHQGQLAKLSRAHAFQHDRRQVSAYATDDAREQFLGVNLGCQQRDTVDDTIDTTESIETPLKVSE